MSWRWRWTTKQNMGNKKIDLCGSAGDRSHWKDLIDTPHRGEARTLTTKSFFCDNSEFRQMLEARATEHWTFKRENSWKIFLNTKGFLQFRPSTLAPEMGHFYNTEGVIFFSLCFQIPFTDSTDSPPFQRLSISLGMNPLGTGPTGLIQGGLRSPQLTRCWE